MSDEKIRDMQKELVAAKNTVRRTRPVTTSKNLDIAGIPVADTTEKVIAKDVPNVYTNPKANKKKKENIPW